MAEEEPGTHLIDDFISSTYSLEVMAKTSVIGRNLQIYKHI
jgi:hypothetical protein